MKVLGISPLDTDATVSIVEDGKILFAAAEERFSRKKQHHGFPSRALEAAFSATGIRPEEIDQVAYAFLPWREEARLKEESFREERPFYRDFRHRDLGRQLAAAEARIPRRTTPIPGLGDPNEKFHKPFPKSLIHRLAGGVPAISPFITRRMEEKNRENSLRLHQDSNRELEDNLKRWGLLGKLKWFEHHFSHAANSYLSSGFERALIVTIDGYGSGLAASINLGEGGSIRRLHSVRFPNSLGNFYASVTSSLGFRASRHEGKIVGLAAYGDPDVLSEVLRARFIEENGTYKIADNLNIFFSRYLALRFPKIDVAAAYQRVLELVACRMVRNWIESTGCDSVVLSGGVVANVKMNQRLYELEGVRRVFIYPNMGDGGCASGVAMHASWPGGVGQPLGDVYLGPSFPEAEIRRELDRAGIPYSAPAEMAAEVAQRIAAGQVIARFDGRMEYGPRALGNRSILYHARDPHVNQWLNQRLGRTEFMPFAPVTLWEARHRCYRNITGAEHAAEFMTITFDCTDWMRQNCPAAVHVDGTARPQLIRREVNPGYYDIVKEYERLSGSPTLINTSFNMHEEPIVCTPADAVRAFLLGNLDGLAIGPFLAVNPKAETHSLDHSTSTAATNPASA